MESNANSKKKIDSGNQRLASLLDDVTRGNIKILISSLKTVPD